MVNSTDGQHTQVGEFEECCREGNGGVPVEFEYTQGMEVLEGGEGCGTFHIGEQFHLCVL